MQRAALPFASLALLAAGASAAVAMAPPLPCVGFEGGMVTHDLTVLDPESAKSGVTVEAYQVEVRADPSGALRNVPGPVPALEGFYGVRLVHCASGTFFAIRTDQKPPTVAAALSATEFLRAQVQAGRRIGQSDLAEAIRAVYGPPLQLRETEETCGCHVTWPELRPAGMRPYPERSDAFHH